MRRKRETLGRTWPIWSKDCTIDLRIILKGLIWKYVPNLCDSNRGNFGRKLGRKYWIDTDEKKGLGRGNWCSFEWVSTRS